MESLLFSDRGGSICLRTKVLEWKDWAPLLLYFGLISLLFFDWAL